MSQACAAFRLPLSQQQHMRLVDRGRVLEVGTFRTLLGVGVGAGSELMLTSETITSDHRSNLEDQQCNPNCVDCAALGAQCAKCAYYDYSCTAEEGSHPFPNWLRESFVGSGWGKEHSSGDFAKDDDDPIYEGWRAAKDDDDPIYEGWRARP
jgi:hypothetical protein